MANKNTLDGVGEEQLPLEDTQLPVKKEVKLSTLLNLERKNRNIRQPHAITMARYSFNVWEKRLVFRIIESIQKGIYEKLDDSIEIPIRVATVLPKGEGFNKNYRFVEEAARTLRTKEVLYYKAEDNKRKKGGTGFLMKFEVMLKSGILTVKLDPCVYLPLLGGSQYNQFEIETALSFRSVYSMRFYEMLSGYEEGEYQKINIDTLRYIFMLENKYKSTGNFIREVVDVAKEELDAKSPHSFDYETIKYSNSKKIKGVNLKSTRPRKLQTIAGLLGRSAFFESGVNERDVASKVRLLDYLTPEEEKAMKKLGADKELEKELDLLTTIAEARRNRTLLIKHELIKYSKTKISPKEYFLKSLKQNAKDFEEDLKADLKAKNETKKKDEAFAKKEKEARELNSISFYLRDCLELPDNELQDKIDFIIQKGGTSYLNKYIVINRENPIENQIDKLRELYEAEKSIKGAKDEDINKKENEAIEFHLKNKLGLSGDKLVVSMDFVRKKGGMRYYMDYIYKYGKDIESQKAILEERYLEWVENDIKVAVEKAFTVPVENTATKTSRPDTDTETAETLQVETEETQNGLDSCMLQSMLDNYRKGKTFTPITDTDAFSPTIDTIYETLPGYAESLENEQIETSSISSNQEETEEKFVSETEAKNSAPFISIQPKEESVYQEVSTTNLNENVNNIVTANETPEIEDEPPYIPPMPIPNAPYPIPNISQRTGSELKSLEEVFLTETKTPVRIGRTKRIILAVNWRWVASVILILLYGYINVIVIDEIFSNIQRVLPDIVVDPSECARMLI